MELRSILGRRDESSSRLCWTIWITILLHSLTVTNPHRGANGLKRELFFLNLEDGFFGCQVNESVDVLKVFELSKLCDGSPQCFLGSDELHENLKCSDDCTEKTGRKCENGACLSSQCYCNDGFGGKGCEMPDENECKFRPCDIFAHCTNTLGSFGCSCYSGYEGDGFRCKDIDECKNPTISSTCVDHAECWNLPGHYACRCLPGYEGDGRVECRDINECRSNPCGQLASCEEKPGGGYTCHCHEGYNGNALKSEGCQDVDECSENPCSHDAECHNKVGSYECVCPQGYIQSNNVTLQSAIQCTQVDVTTKCRSNFDCVNNAECVDGSCGCRPGFEPYGPQCIDIDECKNSPCGVQAVCGNVPGGFRCECEGKFPVGDPFTQCKASCEDVNCGPHAYCSANELHSESGEAYCVCEEGWTYDPKNISAGCVDINECQLGSFGPCGNHSICHNVDGTFSCSCAEGFRSEGHAQLGCYDVNECEENHSCGINSLCVNIIGSYDCTCPTDMIPDPDPRVKCTRVTKCKEEKECPGNGVCDLGKGYCTCPEPNVGDDCRHPCEKVTCGPRAECRVVNDLATCVCPTGFHGSPSTSEGCLDIDECLFQPCGEGICRNEPGRYRCECPLGFEPLRVHNSSGYPESCRSVSPRSCRRGTDCPAGEECVDHTANRKVCVCPRGFTRDFKLGGCRDVNECMELDLAPCGLNALCRNVPGSYECTCPQKFPVGNPYQKCEECNAKRCPCPSPFRLVNASCLMDNCSPTAPCSNGGDCISVTGGLNYCACQKGYVNAPDGSCQDVNECLKVGVCGPGAECFNKPGTYKCVCPINHQGDPYKDGCSHPLLKCHASTDCAHNEKCVDPGVCVCAPPYQKDGNNCHRVCDVDGEGSGKVCSAAQKRTCIAGNCGQNAECVDGGCVCKLGYEGDPYKNCEDLNECEEDICGRHAQCINLPGTYDCRCELAHPLGNPFVECFKLPQNLVDCSRGGCACGLEKPCPDGFVCKGGVCVDECSGVTCGANSMCLRGKCVCVAGFSGQSPSHGCEYRTCDNDLSCGPQEICYGDSSHGNRICVDGCSRMECGPNSICFTENHRSSCVCKELFEGNGQDCAPVKISERVDECGSSVECFDNFLCSHAPNGVRKCVDPCATTTCGGPNQICVRERGKAICKCKTGFKLSQDTGVCDLPALSECSIDDECAFGSGCVQDGFGIGRCTSLCQEVTCGQNAICLPEVIKGVKRRASCHCNAGFSGNPDDRVGCLATMKNECVEDVDCSENHVCQRTKEGQRCQLACEGVKCGPNAVCISNNHAAQCQCLPGKYKGDPSNPLKGCSPVPCIYNTDCLSHQTCNRLENQCHDVCAADSCGTNSICIPEKHSYRCACPQGFGGHDPESACHPIKDCLSNNPCHSSAVCGVKGGQLTCDCREGSEGDPYGSGCEVKEVKIACTSHEECPKESICRDRKCVDPCEGGCAGKYSICRLVDRIPTCACQEGFVASTRNNETICTRMITKCNGDGDCPDGICVDKQCKIICTARTDCGSDEVCLFGMCMTPCIGSVQCPSEQTCAGGYCVLGCRTNKDCAKEEACLNHQCSNPCTYDGVCGPNSLCRPISHSPQCYCPDGFMPSPSDGCYRNNTHCASTHDCQSAHICIGGSCFLSCDLTTSCARGEQCQNNVCVKVCYTDSNCQLGEICVEGVCTHGCRSDSDCGLSETCLSSKCHCATGFTSGPTGCRDLNECDDPKSCHSSSNCFNSPGSYRCECPEGLFSTNPRLSPCNPPQECDSDPDCSDLLTCHVDPKLGVKKCIEPCALTKCGPRAKCRVAKHRAECVCPVHHMGDPYSMDKGCESVECRTDVNCSDNKYCDEISGRCLNPCEVNSCGSHALCEVEGHQGTCSCVQGFILKNGSCQDENECEQEQSQCHGNCTNTIGGFECKCLEGMVGDPRTPGGCKPAYECVRSEDCPLTAHCLGGKCQGVCATGTCGVGTKCEAIQHKATCSCLPNFVGDPATECRQVKCQEESECGLRETCYNHECLSPCDIPHICGQHSNCTVISHKALCLCLPSYTGDPVLGCIRIQTCDAQTPCPSSSVCVNGNCRQFCTAHRDCASIQSCLHGICQSPCTFDSDCPTSQICESGFCKDHGSCRDNSNCDPDQVCKVNSQGISECTSVCEKETFCPRNSHCLAKDHVGICQCNEGFVQDTVGNCVKVECNTDADCSHDKACADFQCILACKLPNSCPSNSICTSENHQQKCSCGPGFVNSNFAPNGSLNCVAIDFCASNPCGPGGICESTSNSFKCICAEGQGQSSSSISCRTQQKCVRDNDCPDSFRCTPSGSCTKACDPLTCGPHSKCVNAHGPCVCNRGYIYLKAEDPSAGCYPNPAECPPGVDCIKKTSYCNGTECSGPCESNAECSLTEVCQMSQCVNPCDTISPCGVNALCSTLNHIKVCGCAPDFTGLPQVECVRVAVPCQSDTDCGPRQSCSNGICFPKCQSDLGCASNERCVEDHCMLTCRMDNDCFLNHVCLSGMCVSGCRSNEDCASEESCQYQKCVDLCKMDACGPNSACRTVDHQPKCSCPAGMLPNPTPLLGCIREPIACNENRNCADSLLCVSGICKQSCAATSNCYANEICHGGFCSASCRKDGDCPEHGICEHSVCVEGCRNNDVCKSSESCVDTKCSDPCKPHCHSKSGNCTALQTKFPCGSNSLCTTENHEVTCRCESPYVGDPYKFCAAPEIGCKVEGQCPQGMTCVEEQCRISCLSDDKCQSDERCFENVCQPVCSQDSQCGDNKICQGRICVTGCRSDVHCPANLSCRNRQCIDPCQSPSVCGSCATCETVDHHPVCSCPLEWYGNPEVRCQKPYAPCNSGMVCSAGQTCIFGSCVQKCQVDGDCQCLQSCHLGHCHNRCSGNTDCTGGSSCEAGHCRPKCQFKSDCSPLETCVEGQCVDPCLTNSCSMGPSHCKVSQHHPICLCSNGSPEINGECGEGLCLKDSDCKNVNHACAGGNCKNPCLENGVCGQGASCRMINRKPLCTCPIGWTGSPTTECVLVGKDDCRGKGCGRNATCSYTEIGFRCTCLPTCVPRIPGSPEEGCKCPSEGHGQLTPGSTCDLKCGTLAVCRIEDNKQKRCICPKDFPEGDPMIGCSASLTVERIDDCRVRPCGAKGATCAKVKGQGTYACHCPQGTIGNPDLECLRVKTECHEDSDTNVKTLCNNETEHTCHSNEDCENGLGCALSTGTCQDPCTWTRCSPNQECKVEGHLARCLCKTFVLNQRMELTCPESVPTRCEVNEDCELADACIFGICQDPCAFRKCHEGKICTALHHAPYCLCTGAECSPTVEICIKDSGCPNNLSCVNYRCQSPCDDKMCQSGQSCFVQEHKALCEVKVKVCNVSGSDDGLDLCKVSSDLVECSSASDCDPHLLCLNDLCTDPCYAQNPCAEEEVCRVVNQTIACQISPPPISISCNANSQCPPNSHCSTTSNTCENPCTVKKCGPTSYCVVENQVAKCLCLEGGMEHEGNCIRRFRTDFPRPEMTVNCLADGIQVDILTGPFGTDFRSNGSEFNGLLYVKGHSKDPQCRKSVQPYLETVDFEVKFGSCGLIHNDGEASFVMVIQKHPRLVTYNAQAYDIKCVYMTGEKTITLGFNVSMLTTSGTIANTGPPPTCSMRIATATGGEITSAEIGESLLLRIDVQPSSIYGGFARRCVAKTMEGDGENEYPVTDEDGCASDPSVFGDWEFEPETQILMAHFNAFKFPSSSSIKFQCNVRVCFGTCPPVNCRGQEAFGRRKRSADQNLLTHVGYEGQLREEVQIESNPILAIERREDRFQDPTESPQTLKEEVCISTTGFILSLIVTSILSLVAVAVAVSCWILAYKRRKRDLGPLPHPPEFPNPLFTSTELITEPLPDYMS